MDSNPATGCVTCNLGQYTPRKAVACTDCPAGKADTDYSSRTECAGASRSPLQPLALLNLCLLRRLRRRHVCARGVDGVHTVLCWCVDSSLAGAVLSS